MVRLIGEMRAPRAAQSRGEAALADAVGEWNGKCRSEVTPHVADLVETVRVNTSYRIDGIIDAGAAHLLL